MKVVILAGGVGNVLAGDTDVGPKPMVEIGGQPLLWHILKHFSHYGLDEFVIAVGHRGDVIKQYLSHYRLNQNDVRIDVGKGEVVVYGEEPDVGWIAEVVDTGRRTQTAGRLLRLARVLGDETFMLTFGDAVADIDLNAVLDLHRAQERLVTITAVHPTPRFGELQLTGDRVSAFSEKPMESGWVNGGYMVMEPGVFEFIEGDHEPLSPGPLERLAAEGQLAAYQHIGFWQSVDALRDKAMLDSLWSKGSAPWEIWKQ